MHVSEAHTSREMRFQLHTKAAYNVVDWALRQYEGYLENQVDGRAGPEGGESEEDAKPGDFQPHRTPDSYPTLEENQDRASVLVIPRWLYEGEGPSGAHADLFWGVLSYLVEDLCPAGGDEDAPCSPAEQEAARELMGLIGPAPEAQAPDSARYIVREGDEDWSEPMDFDEMTGNMDFDSMEEVSAIHRLNVGDIAVLGDYYKVKRVA